MLTSVPLQPVGALSQLATGSLRSILKGPALLLELLPALSKTAPEEIDTFEPSSVAPLDLVKLAGPARPEVASLALKVWVTTLLYQSLYRRCHSPRRG